VLRQRMEQPLPHGGGEAVEEVRDRGHGNGTLRIDNVDTDCYATAMSKPSFTLAEERAQFAGADRSPAASPDLKGSINLRIETQTRQLIDDAAALLGKTRTEFMIDCARALAIDTLLDRRHFALDEGQFQSFADALDNPPPPGPKLRALLRQEPAWKT
jgi:uncharacterized protein (DUF1778 family)